jgi:hypothetical protein
LLATEDFVLFQFSVFNTEKNRDEVQVWVGGKTETTAKMVARLSGSEDLNMIPVFYSPNNYMFVKFTSDREKQTGSFSADWKASKCSAVVETWCHFL